MLPALEAVARRQPDLARQLDADWSTPLHRFSEQLWEPFERPGFEPALREALVSELAGRVPDPGALATAVEREGAVLTPHHVCPTNGPTFGATDWIAGAAQPGPLLILAWSGVPMSNSAVSGALCFKIAPYDALLRAGTPELARQKAAARDRERDGVTERRVVLIPPELRDALVYQCPMPERAGSVIAAASPALRALLPDPEPGERYSAWCTRVCERVQRALLGRDDVHYVDLNRVAARYLARVLDEPDHPIQRALSTEVPGLSWWYGRRPGKKESVETVYAGPFERLRERIASDEACPGLIPVFGALRMLSRIRLLGGFRQVQYLEEIAAAWVRAGIEDRGVPGRLVTGRLGAHPLDLVLGHADRSMLPGPDAPMSVLWEPLLARLAAD